MKNYPEALEFLFNALPMYQRVGKAAYKANLDRTLALDEYFGHPHRKFASVHVAGTNGKGSVSHMLAAVLQCAGYRVGLYTSPHLRDFRERIRVNGEMIPETEVVDFVNHHAGILSAQHPSFFEMCVAMAFDYFARAEVDIAVVEVGMGGRLDSTNILSPLVSVITNIGMDHCRFLGHTLYEIGREKAGIMKPGVPVVIGQEQEEVRHMFLRRAAETGSPPCFAERDYKVEYSLQSTGGTQVMNVYRPVSGQHTAAPAGTDKPADAGDRGTPSDNGDSDTPIDGQNKHRDEAAGSLWIASLETGLLGLYQQRNLPAVLKVLELLRDLGFPSTEEDLRSGLLNVVSLTGLRGRWEVLGNNPLIVCDTGHNREGLEVIASQLMQTAWKTLHIILGLVDDKDPDQLLPLLPRQAVYYFTQAPVPRAMDRERLASEALRFGLFGKLFATPRLALEAARGAAVPEDMIFIGGSSFVVAEVL